MHYHDDVLDDPVSMQDLMYNAIHIIQDIPMPYDYNQTPNPTQDHSPNPKPLLDRPLPPLKIDKLPTPDTSRNRRLHITTPTLTPRLTRIPIHPLPILLTRLLQPMRNAKLPPLLRILDPPVPLLPDPHRLVLHVHAVDVQGLRDGVDGSG